MNWYQKDAANHWAINHHRFLSSLLKRLFALSLLPLEAANFSPLPLQSPNCHVNFLSQLLFSVVLLCRLSNLRWGKLSALLQRGLTNTKRCYLWDFETKCSTINVHVYKSQFLARENYLIFQKVVLVGNFAATVPAALKVLFDVITFGMFLGEMFNSWWRQ